MKKMVHFQTGANYRRYCAANDRIIQVFGRPKRKVRFAVDV